MEIENYDIFTFDCKLKHSTVFDLDETVEAKEFEGVEAAPKFGWHC